MGLTNSLILKLPFGNISIAVTNMSALPGIMQKLRSLTIVIPYYIIHNKNDWLKSVGYIGCITHTFYLTETVCYVNCYAAQVVRMRNIV